MTPDDPRLWCALGDLTLKDVHYETAWERSRQRSTRAQRSLARSAQREKNFEEVCVRPAVPRNAGEKDMRLRALQRWRRAAPCRNQKARALWGTARCRVFARPGLLRRNIGIPLQAAQQQQLRLAVGYSALKGLSFCTSLLCALAV